VVDTAGEKVVYEEYASAEEALELGEVDMEPDLESERATLDW
jgi:hypothetical protein